MAQVSLDIDEVARCAWNEILQTAPRSTSLFGLLEDLLEPGPNLVWRDRGPGRGTEMRRSFSGLFGRFFARAYLEQHHDFVWFTAIDGDSFHLSPSWRVIRKPRSQTEMPDWICARPGELAIGEAKGSHQKGNATRGGMPGPIKTADGQIQGIRVQKGVRRGSKTIWQSKRPKGWAVMSRWGLANPARDPFLYALDPETEGETPKPEEISELVQAVARTYVEQTALGLGLLMSVDGKLAVAPHRRVQVAGDQDKAIFAGTIITPFGSLDRDFERAKEIASLVPKPDLVLFVGFEEGLLNDYLKGLTLVPRSRRRIGDLSLVGRDGLVMAPVQQIIDVGYSTDQD
ncbi:hypothetical protein [Wenxinia marina]|uniref:hypothetical protein n=1 Tax=Wenxinia marina TaxID=390641 RepID=UPI0012E05E65|nr:hypothetical protein [Wenxinia marina]GGL81397.1 hypothetical protein GCM10011392_40040 [Wenxinia marina]